MFVVVVVVYCVSDHYVFAEGCDEQTEVRSVEEESLFTLAYPHIVQDFNRERAEAQQNKTKSKFMLSHNSSQLEMTFNLCEGHVLWVVWPSLSLCVSGKASRWV